MATIKEIEITRNWGERPQGNCDIVGNVYFGVAKGEPYDLVRFKINELDKDYSWFDSLCVACGTSEALCNDIASLYAKTLTQKDIKDYRQFLIDGERWGWD